MTNYFIHKSKILWRYYCVVFSLFLLSSCQTTALYQFEALRAPDIIIPPDVKTYGFVDRNTNFDIDTLGQYFKLNTLNYFDSTNYDSIKAENCHLGLSENLSEYLEVDTIPFIQLPPKYIVGDRNFEPMSWAQVDSVCELTGSDVLICLEDIQIFNKYEVLEEEEYWGITDINYYSIWRIYDPLVKKYHDERIITDSLFTEVNSTSHKTLVEEKLPRRITLMSEVSYEIGRQYAELISPTWNTISRKYFSAGDKDFGLARYYLENDDLEQSMLLWEKLSKSEKVKIAGRAAYNMAMGYELKEEFSKANHWMRKSINFYRKFEKKPSEYKIVKEYYKLLTERTQNNYRLDKFFGEK